MSARCDSKSRKGCAGETGDPHVRSIPSIPRHVAPCVGWRHCRGGGALIGRPSYAQPSMLWYSASASGADEEWSKMFKAKTGVGSSIFVSAASSSRAHRAGGARQAGPLLGVGHLDPGADEPVVTQGHTGAIRQPGERALSAGTRLAGYWTPINTLTLSMAYNADHIRPEDAPKTWRICCIRNGRAG